MSVDFEILKVTKISSLKIFMCSVMGKLETSSLDSV